MKKIVSVLTAAVLAVSVLAACGNSAAPAPAATEAPAAEAPAAEAPAAEAPADAQSFKVGIVQFVDDASLNQINQAICAQLEKKGAELGVTFEITNTNGQADSVTLNAIAEKLVGDGMDVIVPIATPAAVIMQAATEDNQIPVVFSAVSDPEGAGLVASNAAPGSNVTGTSDALNTNAVMDLMFAANPGIKKVGLLYNKSEDASKAPIAAAIAYCRAKGVEVVEKTGTNNDEVTLAADALVAEGVDAVFTPTDNTVMTAELAIYEKFVDAKIPHYCGADSFALNGAFCGYGVNYVDLGTATADLIVEILVNGSSPATTPVVTMDNGIATVNTETAEAIGLSYDMFAAMCTELRGITTAKEF